LENYAKKKANSKSKSGRKYVSNGKPKNNSSIQNTESNGSGQLEMRPFLYPESGS